MMRYYRKEHTIMLTLTDLFPTQIEDGLADEIREYHRSKGIDYDAVEAEREAQDAAEIQRYKELLLKYAPEELKPLIENDRVYPAKSLSDDSIRIIERWRASLMTGAEQAFSAYNEYLERVQPLMPVGFQQLLDLYLHDSMVLDYSVDGAVLTMEIRGVGDQRYKLEFTGLQTFDSVFNIKSNVWKQHELFVNKDGSIELSILADEAGDRPVIESINEINIVASDVKITRLE